MIPQQTMTHQSWLDRARGPLALVSGLALLVAAGSALVAGEFSVLSRLALAVAILCFGMYIAIDPAKAWGNVTSRESQYGSNAFVMCLAMIGILALVNVLANRYHERWDLTAQRDFSLSEATLKLLADLPAPVHATAYFSSSLPDAQKVEDLLKEYAARSNGMLTWETVDFNMNPAETKLAGVNVDGTIRFRWAGKTGPDDPKQDSITTDEAHITTALLKLVNPTPLKVYYLTGHGERDLDNFQDEGYSDLKTQIQADNYVVESLNLLSTGKVPDDAKAVIIAAPKTALLDDELKALNDYLDGNGRLLLFVDPLQTDSNVGELIKRWDLNIGDGVAVDPVSALGQDPLAIIVQRYGLHTIVKDLGTISLMPFSTSIEIPNLIKKGVDISGLALTSGDRSWLETDRSKLQYTDGEDKKGPLTLAVAVEQVENPPAEEPPPGFEDPNKKVKNRAVIIGSSEMGVNGLIKQQIANRDFILNSLNWITQTDQLITTRPRIDQQRTVFLTPAQGNFVFFSSAVFFPLVILGVGGVIWWMRR
ncbi:MAG TPA: Gldg family protein [Chloroflexota bacterium]|nr:Gldg family protein [Chloroflexota bacterium]